MDTKKLRQKILDLAIHGKLVPQDPNDEPASVLLERIRAEKEQLIKEGKIKKSRKTSSSSDTPHYEQVPFEVPQGWVWTTLGEISTYGECNTITIDEIGKDAWILELEDLEKDTAAILQTLTKKERSIKGVRHKFCKGEVLYSKLRTYLNKVLVAPNDGYCTTEIMPFNSFCSISTDYLCHVLRSSYFLGYTLQCGYGVKMPRLSTNDARKGMIPLPPLAEQLRIVNEIERLFAAINTLENSKTHLHTAIKQTKNKILDLAIHGKLVPQDPNDEPASELLKRINPKVEITCDTAQYGNLPNGWLIVDFNSIFETISSKPYQIKQSQIQSHGIRPVVSQSMNHIEGYTDEANYLHHQSPVLVFGDHTRIVKYIDFDFVVGADGVKIINPLFYQRYAYYMILYASINIEDKGYSRHFCQIAKFTYCLPPLKEQIRIVAQIEELYAQLDKIESSLQA